MTIEELYTIEKEFIRFNQQFLEEIFQPPISPDEQAENMQIICLQQEIEKLKNELKKSKETIDIYYNKISEYEINRKQRIEKSEEKSIVSAEQLMNTITKYFRGNEYIKLQKVLKYAIKYKEKYQGNLTSEELLKLYIISYLQGMEQMFVEAFSNIITYFNIEQPLNQLCKLLYTEKKTQLNEQVMECVNHFIVEEKKKLNLLSDLGIEEVLAKVKYMQMPYCNNVLMLAGRMRQCSGDGKKLRLVKGFVCLSNQQFALVEVNYCDDCGQFYLTQQEFLQIQNKLKGLTIIRDTSNAKGNPSVFSQVSQLESIQMKQQGMNSKLNGQSLLKDMGYDTLKSDEERWRILSGKVVPRLGKNKVIFYLETLIRTNKDDLYLEDARNKWSQDLELIKNYI